MRYLFTCIISSLTLFCYGQDNYDKLTSTKIADKKITFAFNRADEYMASGDYDSAQSWLNKIYLKLSYRKPSLLSYFISSRQAEVYYYNNLHKLGLQEATKAYTIAWTLKDSLLISDACNFLGLFYLNTSHIVAISYFKKGLKYGKQPPYKSEYLELTEPHHIYGNLSEAFEKLGEADSAIYYSSKSYLKAHEIKSARGKATASLNLGSAFLAKKNIVKAKHYFYMCKMNALKSGDFDVVLTSYGGLASCAAELGDKKDALKFLLSGFSILQNHPTLNGFYTSMFLENALNIYKKYNEKTSLIKTLELQSVTQKATYNRNNIQIQSILTAGFENEKRIASLEISKSRDNQSLANTRLYIILLVFLLVVIGFIAYRYYVLQKLRVAYLRNEISKDLHDEVGATLSGIAMYSYIIKKQVINHQQQDILHSLDVINDNASQMVKKLSDIVWAVNPIDDNLAALVQRLRDFAGELTAVKNIDLQFRFDESLKDVRLLMDQRKNIYLICKEAINNAVKYSECNSLIIDFRVVKKTIKIYIKDNGKGFCADSVSKGNGLINMDRRAKEIMADLVIGGQTGDGTIISLSLKIT
jgi:signal transduction histidine kinase